MRSFFRQAAPLLLAVALLVYALKDVPVTSLIQQCRQANYGWITLSALFIGLSHGVRGKRWQQTLLALGYAPTAFRATVALLSGSIASMIIPASGELTRCATLQRTDGVPVAQGIGSVVAERVVDMLMLALTILLAFALEFKRMKHYVADLNFISFDTGWWLIGGGLLSVALSIYLAKRISKHPVLGQLSLVQKGIRAGQGIWLGLQSVLHLPNAGLFIALTVGYQLLTLLATYTTLLSVGATYSLPPTAALTILAVASLGGLAVPTQGGIGTFHFLVSRVLVLYGLTTAEGAIVATFMHTVGLGVTLLLGSASFLIVPLLIKQREQVVQP